MYNCDDVFKGCGKVRGCSFMDSKWKRAIESVQCMTEGILNCPFLPKPSNYILTGCKLYKKNILYEKGRN